jgi:hypothetical protein
VTIAYASQTFPTRQIGHRLRWDRPGVGRSRRTSTATDHMAQRDTSLAYRRSDSARDAGITGPLAGPLCFSAAGNPRNNDAALEPVRELDETAPATDLQISWSESQSNRISKINVRYAA